MTYWPGHSLASALTRRVASSRVRAASTKRSSPSLSTSPRTFRMQKGSRIRKLQTPTGAVGTIAESTRVSKTFQFRGTHHPIPNKRLMPLSEPGSRIRRCRKDITQNEEIAVHRGLDRDGTPSVWHNSPKVGAWDAMPGSSHGNVPGLYSEHRISFDAYARTR